jgi:hypothetical protein
MTASAFMPWAINGLPCRVEVRFFLHMQIHAKACSRESRSLQGEGARDPGAAATILPRVALRTPCTPCTPCALTRHR